MFPRPLSRPFAIANELKGARDGRDSGLFAEFAVAPPARLLATKDVWIDAVVPMASAWASRSTTSLVG